ncbi:hypothetical protein O9H85_16625 [Paenibacillus filicis]|uniref:Uncharacterized protein n=1 Tax=Paenibacillus gyeongsangnamensis TaxID=3388067 RepID=A0ABT4QAV4_9BACL|nr:hypothetical protein [Paenibacillus filicis]MCZ8514017.1 hypothetical protein [Paenibacillus filicis]
MWAIMGILAGSAIILWIEVPRLLKTKMIRELWVFSALLLLGTALSAARSMRVQLSNPLDWIAAVYKPVSDILFSLLK